MIFNEKLSYLRSVKGVTQKEIADALGIHQSTYHHWEAGDTKPNKRRLHALAKYFECDIDYLRSGDSPPRPYILNLMHRTAEAEFTRILSLIHDNPNQLEALVKHLEEFRKEIEK